MGKKALKYGLFLCILGVIVGVLLSVVNAITKPDIEKQEAAKVDEMLNAYSSDYNYDEVTDDYTLTSGVGVNAIYIGTLKEPEEGAKDLYIYKTTGLGYGNGEMVVMVYIQDNTIKQVSIVSTSGQTKGVGTQVEDETYLSCYENAKVSDYAGIKATSHNNKSSDVISGATYSSRGIIEGVIYACDHYTSEVNK